MASLYKLDEPGTLCRTISEVQLALVAPNSRKPVPNGRRVVLVSKRAAGLSHSAKLDGGGVFPRVDRANQHDTGSAHSECVVDWVGS